MYVHFNFFFFFKKNATRPKNGNMVQTNSLYEIISQSFVAPVFKSGDFKKKILCHSLPYFCTDIPWYGTYVELKTHIVPANRK